MTLLVLILIKQRTKGNLRDGNLETLSDGFNDALVFLLAHERDGETLGTETTGTTHAVEVRISITGHVVVDGQVDTLDVDTTSEDVGGNADTLVEVLELLVALDTMWSSALQIQKVCLQR